MYAWELNFDSDKASPDLHRELNRLVQLPKVEMGGKRKRVAEAIAHQLRHCGQDEVEDRSAKRLLDANHKGIRTNMFNQVGGF